MLSEILVTNEIIFLCSISGLIACLFAACMLGKSALIAFICTQSIFSNLFITKQIVLFGFFTTCSDVFAVGGLLGMNIVQEYYGKKAALKTIYINLMLLCLYLVMAQLHLLLVPSPYDSAHSAYATILTSLPRITITSLMVYAIVQWFDTQLYSILARLFNNTHLVVRNTISLVCSQIIDTILFSYIALYGSVHAMSDIIIISSCIKLITIFCMTPCLTFIRSYIRVPHNE